MWQRQQVQSWRYLLGPALDCKRDLAIKLGSIPSFAGDPEMMRRFNALLRERGILKGESKYYISLAHTAEDIEFTIDAWKSAIKELRA